MITVEVDLHNPISQDFYDKTVFSLDPALIPCTCGHAGCLIWYGSYTRKVVLPNQLLLLRVARVRCQVCGHTHAILLSSLVPYSQIPLAIHVAVAQAWEDARAQGAGASSILEDQEFLDENNLSSLRRSFLRRWLEPLRAFDIPLFPLPLLVRTCFAILSRQFMQIKSTRNKLFLLPT